jgi:hypothetical protein
MKRHLAMVVALMLLASGCGGSKPSSPAASSTPSSAVDGSRTLTAAVAKTAGQNFSFTVGEPDDNVTGQWDAAGKAAKLTNPDSPDDIIAIGPDLWTTIDGVTQHYDALKFTSDDSMALLTDPTGALRFLTTAGKVTASSDGTLHGVIDFSAVPADNAATRHLADILAQRVGTAAHTVSFTAKVDGQGRLVKVDLTLPKADNGKDADYQFAITGFTIAGPVTKPTGQIIEAPDAAYRD